ncbi:MAG TPA: XdhC/CoxI family protein [Solirubrobacteraceae bacterium]|nr:XdhC/CoxI family protein [Solirubrobacteraceae bacterium]
MIDSGVVNATQDTAISWLADERRFVQVLLVEVEGSAPLPAGAMMIVDEHGNIEGSITGGCVEGAVVQEAEAIMGADHPAPARLLTYGISDELAGTVGLMCGGIVHILVHELDAETGAIERMALQEHAAGHPVAVATLLDGPTAGRRLAVLDDRIVGSLGEGELLDRNVGREAHGLLEEGKTTVRRFGADGATLGDDLRVHIRSYAPPPQMFIFGAIDFSAALAPFAAQIGYQVTICDARDRFVRSSRFSEGAKVSVAWPQDALRDVELGPRDAVLVFTHDPKFDEPALLAALRTDAGYIGALGSRQTTADREHRLREAGATDDDLARLHAPCGLDIGSRTAEETAVSVLAEIIAARAQRAGTPLRLTSGAIHGRDRVA